MLTLPDWFGFLEGESMRWLVLAGFLGLGCASVEGAPQCALRPYEVTGPDGVPVTYYDPPVPSCSSDADSTIVNSGPANRLSARWQLGCVTADGVRVSSPYCTADGAVSCDFLPGLQPTCTELTDAQIECLDMCEGMFGVPLPREQERECVGACLAD